MRVLMAFCAAIVAFHGLLFANYQITLKVYPEGVYTVSLNNSTTKVSTNDKGEKKFVVRDASMTTQPKIIVEKDGLSGYVVLDKNVETIDAKNLDTVIVKNVNGDRVYDITFIVDPELMRQKHGGIVGVLDTNQNSGAPVGNITDNGDKRNANPDTGKVIINKKRVLQYSEIRRNDPTRTPEYARKIATSGAVCYFVGMGLSYITPFLSASVNVHDQDAAVGTAITVLIIGAASEALEISGSSYAVGGSALAWELGRGKCSDVPAGFDGWGYYKGGWVFIALGGVFGAISSVVPANDAGTAVSLALISLGLNIGKDVFWSISSAKALTMTRKVKNCLQEHESTSYHMRLELQPYCVVGGMGLKCALKF